MPGAMTHTAIESPPDAASTLAQWLSYCERLHPVAIEMGLVRVRTVAQRMAVRFDCPVITVAGTNGKGSTCAMLESILLQAGYRTGVYTSPHLVHFEERLRLSGRTVDASALVAAFAAVEHARSTGGAAVSLTYYEFSTLAIFQVMAQAGLDAIVLEVGLGGRLDATNIIDADCTIITSIDLDHMELLGTTREAIGFEKAGIMRTGRPVVVSDPLPPQSVVDRAMEVGADAWLVGRDFNVSGDKQQWGWAGRGRRYSGLAYPALRGANQLVNAAGVLAALSALRERLPVTAQAVRSGLALVELPGASRLSRANRCWCWMWRITPIPRPRWRPTWTPWVSTRPRTPCSAPWPTRIWGRCSPNSVPSSTTGTSPVCRPRAQRRRPVYRRCGPHRTPAKT